MAVVTVWTHQTVQCRVCERLWTAGAKPYTICGYCGGATRCSSFAIITSRWNPR
jgi:hypothetical protein